LRGGAAQHVDPLAAAREVVRTATQAMVERAHAQLMEMHGVKYAPDPYDAHFQDWTVDPFGAGWHQWKSSSLVDEYIPYMQQPMEEDQVFVVGECWSDAQGWVQGALNTSEAMLQDRLGLTWPEWLRKGGTWLGPRMKPEGSWPQAGSIRASTGYGEKAHWHDRDERRIGNRSMQSAHTHIKIAATEEPLIIAELLLRYLELEGVRHIFGIPGVALGYLLDALKQQQDKFTYHVCRHETGASYMADGFSRVSGRLGVVLVSSGPGATNALTGSGTAQSCNSSVLVISGEVALRAFGKGGFQEGVDAGLNVSAVYRNADHYSAVITHPSNFQTLFTRALRISLSLPRSATHVSLPQDIGGETLGTDIYFPNHPEN